ncbi:glycosyltransferase family 4 protein [Haladaptatus sp. CMAA 1911]|uniref:glycosyltransferase family 4 protein n=1 Tax=unclassified Haladaptatus TaxID=2622732 RepID=UPI0037551C38
MSSTANENGLKIAYIYDAVYPWVKGGAQKRVWEIARRMADDHDVHLYGMRYWDGPSTIERDGVTLHGVCEPTELYAGERRSIPEALYFTERLTAPLLRESFDVIDCQSFPYFPCFSAKAHQLLRRSAFVVTWYEVWDDYWYDYLGRKGVFGKAVERATVRLPPTIIAISEFVRGNLTNIGRKRGVDVVPNGIDFYGIDAVEPVGNDWDVIYVGRLSSHKNVDLLLDAILDAEARIGRPLDCGIIGDGPERESLRAYARELGLSDSVTFLGSVESDEEVIGNFKDAELFVLPSTREGFPNTILEANACGVPSVVIDHEDNGGTAVVEDGVTGSIVEFDADALGAEIASLLANETTGRRMSENAYEFARRHDWNRIVAEMETVYDRAIAKQ